MLILAGYCVFALITSTTMLAANILLYVAEQGMEWFRNMTAIPNKVNGEIEKRNATILAAQNDTQ